MSKKWKIAPLHQFYKVSRGKGISERVVFLSNAQLDCFSACVCSFPFPTSSALMIRLAEIPVWEFLVGSPHNSKVYAVLKYSKHLSHSSSLPILPFLNSKRLFPLRAFSFTNSLFPTRRTGPPICPGQLPDWHRRSRKQGCDWLLWDSAGVIRSFNTSRCLSSSRLTELCA